MTASLDLPPRPRVLVITLRRLGDVLLTTPLIRTLRDGLPGSSVDALVFRGTEGILAGNPDLDSVIAIPTKPRPAELAGIVRRLWRRYDLAVTTQTGDRPTFLALVAGRRRVGFVHDKDSGNWWKRRVLDRAIPVGPDNHRIVELLRLSAALGLSPRPQIVCPTAAGAAPAIATPYAVLHANPMFRFRRWSDDGWRELARALIARGLTVVVTGGPAPEEKAYLDRLWGEFGSAVVRTDGQLDWPALADLLAGASVYVGPDTSMTHLAAGAGAPTVALYGPASPHTIGPWPVGGLDRPWAPAGTIQQRGNVWVVQNPLSCLPCEQLGCDRHLNSHARCLDELAPRQVLAAVDQALA